MSSLVKSVGLACDCCDFRVAMAIIYDDGGYNDAFNAEINSWGWTARKRDKGVAYRCPDCTANPVFMSKRRRRKQALANMWALGEQ